MEQTITIVLQIITIILFLLIGYFIKNYWPKYFETKGANQANKEDIGDITKIVEGIKSGLLTQNEFLKAQLSLNNQHKLNLKAAEREAIFDYNKRLAAWIYSILRFTLFQYDIDNYREIKMMVAEFSKRQYECDLADAHLVLFMHDEEFIRLNMDMKMSIIELNTKADLYMRKIYFSYSKWEAEEELANGNLKEQSKIRYQSRKEIEELNTQFSQDITSQYKVVAGFHAQMRDLINLRLKQLEDYENSIN